MTDQESIVETVRLRVQTTMSRLSLSNRASPAARHAVYVQTRVAIAEARKLEGTIQDAAVWQEIHTLVNELEERLSAYKAQG